MKQFLFLLSVLSVVFSKIAAQDPIAMNGKQIDTYSITERGATSIIIEGHSLEAGMYFYALIADGQVIDTKRMILTK